MIRWKSMVLALLSAACAAESAPDAPAPREPGAPKPVLAWSFEPASPDCNGWAVSGAGALRASPPRSGAYSCKLCSDGSARELTLARDVGSVPPGHYALELWVRRRVQNAGPAEARARLDAVVASGARSASAPAVAVRDAWDRLETTLDLAEPASDLRLTVAAPADATERCLFVDDVLLTRQ